MVESSRDAICLKKLSAELIYNNEKKMIVLTKKYADKIGKKLYLIGEDTCYGIIKLTKVKRVSLEELVNLQDLHKLSKESMKNAEKNKVSYIYEFEMLECFPESKPIEKPKKRKLFIKEFIFGPYKHADYKGFTRTIEMIENIYNYDIEHVSNKTLQDDLRLAVSYRSRLLKNEKIKYGKETIINLGTKILKEIIKRKKACKMDWKANPEEGSEAYKILWSEVELDDEGRNILLSNKLQEKNIDINKLLPELEDKLIVKDFVNIVGSSVDNSSGKQPNDVDILVRLKDTDFIKRTIQTHLSKKLNKLNIGKPLHLFLEPEGPHDSFIPIYNLKLELAKPFRKIKMEELSLKELPKDGEKEIGIKNFPKRMQIAMNIAKESNKWYPFVMQWHYRGHLVGDKEREKYNIPERYSEWLQSLHTDLRLGVPDKTGKLDHCEGITLLSPTSTDKSIPDLVNKQDFNNIRCVFKNPPPLSWLKVEGIYKKGDKETDTSTVFIIVARGIYKPIIVEDHRLIVQFKPQKGNVNMKNLEIADKKGIYIDRKPDKNLKDLPEFVNFHIAHIGDRHIILGDKIKKENIK